ncbi:unnamed protein product, partial [Tenebrio molitor]
VNNSLLSSQDRYIKMKFTVAFALVVVSMVSADIPRKRIEIVRKPAPYVASGWTPAGQQLNLPLRSAPPVPAASYGPPVEVTTTEQPTTTEETTAETLAQQVEEVEAEKEKPEKLQEQPQGGQYYLVLPQEQSVVYTIPRSAALLAVPKGNLMATPARFQAVPLSSAVASSMYSPFSASYIQIYQ